MLEIHDNLAIPLSEIQLEFIRASGPGGQNVNRTASAVQLRFDLDASTSLPDSIKDRLRRIAHNRISKAGILIIEAKRFRDQDRNRNDALARLIQLVARAAKPPIPRRTTRPNRASVEKRLQDKRARATKKRDRRYNRRRDDPR
jgi:ribosome-associated protein